jgi:hypothetical protein
MMWMFVTRPAPMSNTVTVGHYGIVTIHPQRDVPKECAGKGVSLILERITGLFFIWGTAGSGSAADRPGGSWQVLSSCRFDKAFIFLQSTCNEGSVGWAYLSPKRLSMLAVSMRYLFFHSKTRRIDWWTIVLLLISLFSFAGAAAIMWVHSG